MQVNLSETIQSPEEALAHYDAFQEYLDQHYPALTLSEGLAVLRKQIKEHGVSSLRK